MVQIEEWFVHTSWQSLHQLLLRIVMLQTVAVVVVVAFAAAASESTSAICFWACCERSEKRLMVSHHLIICSSSRCCLFCTLVLPGNNLFVFCPAVNWLIDYLKRRSVHSDAKSFIAIRLDGCMCICNQHIHMNLNSTASQFYCFFSTLRPK